MMRPQQMPTEDHEAADNGFNREHIDILTIARVVQSWVDWHCVARSGERLETDDGTQLMALPVPMWPSHRMLKAWVRVIGEHRRHLNILAEAMAEVKATSDGDSAQPIADIVAGCLRELEDIAA